MRAADGEPGRSRPPVPAGERRYTEEELALILNRAAERQEGMQPSAPRYTLAEIQEIAAGAGIAPEHVVGVAATIRDARAQRGGGVLGAPERFRFEESIDGEIADDVVGELLDAARRELGVQGSVTEALGSIEWKGRDALGTTFVTVTRRGGRTTIGVLCARTDAAGVTWTLGGFGAIAGSAALATALIAGAGITGPVAAALAIAGGGSGAWLSARTVWRRVARRWSERTAALGSALVAAARHAVEERRTVGDGDRAPG
jgi:hypothetical protein